MVPKPSHPYKVLVWYFYEFFQEPSYWLFSLLKVINCNTKLLTHIVYKSNKCWIDLNYFLASIEIIRSSYSLFTCLTIWDLSLERIHGHWVIWRSGVQLKARKQRRKQANRTTPAEAGKSLRHFVKETQLLGNVPFPGAAPGSVLGLAWLFVQAVSWSCLLGVTAAPMGVRPEHGRANSSLWEFPFSSKRCKLGCMFMVECQGLPCGRSHSDLVP